MSYKFIPAATTLEEMRPDSTGLADNAGGSIITLGTGSTWMVGGGRRNMWKSLDNAASWTQVTNLPNYGGGGGPTTISIL